MRARLAHAAERLDERAHDPAVLAHSMEQVAQVNRLLGGTRAVLRAVREVLPINGPVRIVDVGCGSGDVSAAVADDLLRRGRDATLVAGDLHPQILDLAQQRLRHRSNVAVARLDARALPLRRHAFDVALMSLALHHFEDEEPVAVLRELGRVARVVVINDLERCWSNYAGARLLAASLWSNNRLTRHDGPLSVLRSFTAPELVAMAQRAGLSDARVHRRFFHRLVLIARSG